MSLANRDQIKHWNEEVGPRWVAHRDIIDRLVQPLSERLLAEAQVEAGHSVLDVGCGTGATAVALAHEVGDSGWVSGIDVSLPMLEAARSRAREAGVTVNFIFADAQTARLGTGLFDLCFSRFGVMFFDDPPAAFANLRTSLKPDGRLLFLCWQSLQRNPWAAVPLSAAAPHLKPQPPEPGAPGPFALADEERLGSVLLESGFEDPTIEECRCEMVIGRGVDEALRVLQRVGPCATLLDEVTEEAREAALFDMRVALSPHEKDGRVTLGASAWMVSARPRKSAS